IATNNDGVPARCGHSATLSTNNQSIIVFGGAFNIARSINGIAVLHLTTYAWISVNASGNPPIKAPSSHTASLYNDYIFFAFGAIDINKFSSSPISILDISNNQFKWVSSYYPRTPSTPSPSPTANPSNSNTGVIIGSVIGSVVGVGLLCIIGYLIYNSKLKKRIRFSDIQVSGNE
ncbi:544_t:CDS:2, partial [Scutellospora calospora]